MITNMRQGIFQKLIRFRQFRLIVTLLCMTTFNGHAISQSLNEHERVSYQAELDQLAEQLKKLQLQLKKDIKKRSLVESQLSDTEINIGTLSAKLQQLKKQAASMTAKLTKLKQKQSLLNQQTKKQYALLAEHIKQAYLLDEKNQLKILLNQSNPEEFDRQINYLQFVNQARQKQLKNYRTLVEENDRLAESIFNKQQAIDIIKTTALVQKAELKSLQLKRQEQLSLIETSIITKQTASLKLKRDSEVLNKLLFVVTKTVKKKQPRSKQIPAIKQAPVSAREFEQAKGDLPWPVKGQVITLFGNKRPGSGIAWEGVNLAAAIGEPIQAVFSGRIVFADWFQGQGLLMIIDHGQGYLSLYGHNQSLLKNIGDWVVGGEDIATVGNSGGQQQSGLYFEIRHDGVPQDPKLWCEQQKKSPASS